MEKENKPIIQATLGDLKEMIEDMFATPTDYPHDKPPEGQTTSGLWIGRTG